MWDKLKRKVLVIAAIMLMICSIPKVVNAAPVVINVSTGAEFLQAIDDINSGSATDYVINLTADIDIFTESVIPIKRGNVTIIGNGYEITNIIGILVGNITPPYPTLTLGKQDGSDILKINGSYTGVEFTKSLFEARLGSVINMYSGVDIYNRAANDPYAVGVVFTVDNSTLNMYGGSIKNCSYLNAINSIHPMIYVHNKATFNMSGGEISNNNISSDSSDFYSSAIFVSSNAVANLTGGVITKNKITFNDSTLDNEGGAISVHTATLNISNMQITENEISGGNVVCGGAIYAYYSNVFIDNSVIARNKVTSNNGKGGGIYANNSDLEIKNSLVAFNSSSHEAADILFETEGAALYLPDADAMNAKQGSSFTDAITGWYEDDFTNRWSSVNSTNPFTALQNNFISGQFRLVAGYENAVLMSYDPNGGQGSVYHQHIDTSAKVKDNVAINITRSGYNFIGWNTEADGSGTDYTVGANLTVADTGVILYAQWEVKPVTPETGDIFNPNIFMSLMILSGIGVVVLNKKYKNKEN
ncbi:MAG: InlB B-repeat-containing protein [Erysipelotrichaceae bacterium]|jgi:hypothetical protein